MVWHPQEGTSANRSSHQSDHLPSRSTSWMSLHSSPKPSVWGNYWILRFWVGRAQPGSPSLQSRHLGRTASSPMKPNWGSMGVEDRWHVTVCQPLWSLSGQDQGSCQCAAPTRDSRWICGTGGPHNLGSTRPLLEQDKAHHCPEGIHAQSDVGGMEPNYRHLLVLQNIGTNEGLIRPLGNWGQQEHNARWNNQAGAQKQRLYLWTETNLRRQRERIKHGESSKNISSNNLTRKKNTPRQPLGKRDYKAFTAWKRSVTRM